MKLDPAPSAANGGNIGGVKFTVSEINFTAAKLSFIVWFLQHGCHEAILSSGFISISKYSPALVKLCFSLICQTPQNSTRLKQRFPLFFSIFYTPKIVLRVENFIQDKGINF